MGDFYTNAVRHPEDVGVGHIRRTVTFDQAGIATGAGVPIGALEAGAIILGVHALVETAFNGTAPTLDVGSAAVPAGVAPSAGIAPGTPGFKTGPTLNGALVGTPLAANTVIYAKMGGTGQTTGRAIIIVTFVNRREIEGIPFPNNP